MLVMRASGGAQLMLYSSWKISTGRAVYFAIIRLKLPATPPRPAAPLRRAARGLASSPVS